MLFSCSVGYRVTSLSTLFRRFLTGGDYRFSPGFKERDGVSEREMYRRFVKNDLLKLESALLLYGAELTATLLSKN